MERYLYQRVLGMGNFGKAWLVRSRDSDRPYVIKEVHVGCMGEKEREQAVNEVAILGRLRHVNIVRYKEAFVAGASGGGVLGIVMEYADGGDLAEKIDEARAAGRTFRPTLIMNWFVQLCLALHYMHSERILHRDLKPSNLFLTSKGIVKVGDFGIAKLLRSTVDHASTAIGTPYYLSPEICRRQHYNQKSDMWAAGCILYELITLSRPFDEQEFSTLILGILSGGYAPIPRSYGPALEELVAVLLSVDPALRPTAHAILTSSEVRPHVTAFTDRKSVIPVVGDSPSSSPAHRPNHVGYKKPAAVVQMRTSSLHAKSPLPHRHGNRDGSHFTRDSPAQSDGKGIHPNKPKMVDSPLVKEVSDVTLRERQSSRKTRFTHSHTVSEPTQHRQLPVPSTSRCVNPKRMMVDSPLVNSMAVKRRPSTRKTRSTHVYTVSEPAKKHSASSKGQNVQPKFRKIDSTPGIEDVTKATMKDRHSTKSSGISHRHTASVPTEHVGRNTPSHYHVTTRSVSSSQRRAKHDAPSVQIKSGPPQASARNDTKGIGTKAKTPPRPVRLVYSPAHTKTSRKRKSCIPAIDGDFRASPYIPVNKLPEVIPKNRRLSLPDRVRDSKFLSRLISSENRSSKREQCKTPPATKAVPRSGVHSKEKPTKSASVSKSMRPRSQPVEVRMKKKTNPTPLTKDKSKANDVHESAPPSMVGPRSKSRLNIPRTCLFPKTPENHPKKTRTLVKHGTYTLHLPKLSGDYEASTCKRCGCNLGTFPAKLFAGNCADDHLEDQCNEDGAVAGGGEETRVSLSKAPDGFVTSMDLSPDGSFRRRNAIRRKPRDTIHIKRRRSSFGDVALKRNDADVWKRPSGNKPDVVPPSDDEVFIDPIEQERGVPAPKGIARGEGYSAMEADEDLEIAEFLHAGMGMPNDLTQDLRGRFEELQKYLERRLGPERALLAYNVMSSTSARTGRRLSEGGANSGEVVRLVADVIGPGKMKYFPILVQAMNLNARCH